MKYFLLILVALALVFGPGIWDKVFNTQPTAVLPEIQKSNYRRPVQEGTCFRQFTTDNRSVLVCG